LAKEAQQPNLTSQAEEELMARAKNMSPEVQAVAEKARQLISDVKKSLEELQKVRARQDDLSDDIAIENVNIKAETDAIKDFDDEIIVYSIAAIGGIIIGFVMMISGFERWYKKVQVYQDVILRKQADVIKQQTDNSD
jgi:hypothetical protein